MKQGHINSAYGVLLKIQNYQLPIRLTYKLYRLAKQLEPIYMCQYELERNLLKKHHGYIGDHGIVMFGLDGDTEEDEAAYIAAFQKDVAELNDMDVDIDFDPIVLEDGDLADLRLSMADMAGIDGFIVFE